MNNLQVFNNELFGEVRFIEVDGKPYAVANDVAKALGYANISRDIQRHCKYVKKQVVYQNGTSHSKARNSQEMLIIPESDIYRLIIKSRLPEAEKFEQWVMEEVLPSIRQTEKVKLSIGVNYYIDRQGNVYNKKGNKLKLQENKKGYLRANLYLDNKNHKLFFIHRLVMMTFSPIEGMENLQVNHKNGNKKDNRLENLEWCTNLENMQHSYREGVRKPKLTKEQMDFIDNNYHRIYTNEDIANKYNITKYDVYDIVRGRKRNLNLTKEEVEEIKIMYENKLTYVKIANLLNVNESVIRSYLKYNKFFSINRKNK